MNFNIIKVPQYESSKESPYYLVTCPNCKNPEKLTTIYLVGTYKCMTCLEQFDLTKEHIILVP